MAQTIENYLDEEDIIVRTTDEVNDYILKHKGQAYLNNFHKIAEQYDYGRVDPHEFYSTVAQLANGSVIYDLYSSRCRNAIQWEISQIQEIAKFSQEDSVLDLCSGTGLIACYLAQLVPNGEVVGIDNCWPMIEAAEQRASKRKLSNTQFIWGDKENLYLDPNSFDKILCIQSLVEGDNINYFSRDADVIQSHLMRQRLKPLVRALTQGGKLITALTFHLSPTEHKAHLDYEIIKHTGFMERAGLVNATARFSEIVSKETPPAEDFKATYVVFSAEKA
jgi:SAM-dependent methyltransferase